MKMAKNNEKIIRVVCLVAFYLWIGNNYQCTCFGLPRFQSVPTTVKTFENNTVDLPCVFSGPHTGVRWYFGDILIHDSRSRNSHPLNDRFQFATDGSLTVLQVKSEDTGEYYCEIILADAPAIRQEHAIEVQYPPTVVSYPSGNVWVRLGSSFEITCDATGVPQPIISWRRLHTSGALETLAETTTRRQLRIDVTSREMGGTYQCVANNGVEEPAVAGVNLYVNYIPEVQSPVTNIHTKIGYRTQVECFVWASPSATVQWYLHGVPVMMDNHITRTDVDVTPDSAPYAGVHSKHTLSIRGVRDRDMGMYECRAVNELGAKSVLINFSGMPKPSIFKSSPIRSMGRTFNLLWQTESYSPISEYRLKFRRELPRRKGEDWREITIPAEYSDAPIHTAAYTLPGLDVGVVYEVAVSSRNRYGWSELSKIYRFATGGEVDSPSMITEERRIDDDVMMNGDDLASNSIDEEQIGTFDYTYSSSWRSFVDIKLTMVLVAMVVAIGAEDIL